MLTMQRVELGTKEGKAFLRKVIRDYDRLPYDEGWTLRCNEGTQWRVRFERTVKGELGEPDQSVSVDSDCEIARRGKAGVDDGYGAERPITICEVRHIVFTGCDVAALCSLLLEGAPLCVVASRGSQASSELGLSFYFVEVCGGDFRGVRIGGETIAANGRTICSGSVRIRD